MNCTSDSVTAMNHDQFLTMLPVIQFQARRAFKRLQYDIKQEYLSEVVGHAWQAFVRLCETGKTGQATAWSLARFAVRAVRSGRRTGNRQNIRDINTEIERNRSGEELKRPVVKPNPMPWLEHILADERARPDYLAITRMDFGDWLGMLPQQKRQIAEFLASGESTREAAEHFGISPGRISQIRRELELSWNAFQSGVALADSA